MIQVSTENHDADLKGKRQVITKSLSKLYLNRIKELAKTNLNNGKAVDDYTSAGQGELTNKSG